MSVKVTFTRSGSQNTGTCYFKQSRICKWKTLMEMTYKIAPNLLTVLMESGKKYSDKMLNHLLKRLHSNFLNSNKTF